MTYRAIFSPFAVLFSGAKRLLRVIKNRRQTQRLYDLSDAQLEDIGLTRDNVRWAMDLPLFQDPAPLLKTFAHQRAEGLLGTRSDAGLSGTATAQDLVLSVFAPFSQTPAQPVRTSESSLAA